MFNNNENLKKAFESAMVASRNARLTFAETVSVDETVVATSAKDLLAEYKFSVSEFSIVDGHPTFVGRAIIGYSASSFDEAGNITGEVPEYAGGCLSFS